MAENVTYTYYIKKTNEGDGSYNSPSGASNISQTNYTFTNLDQGTSYDVKVEVKADKAGNIGTGSLLNQTTATIGGASEGLTQGNIVAGPVTWKSGKASTTLTTNSGLQIQYQINTTTEGKWQVISSGGTVGNLNHGDTVFARLYDGKNHGDYASVNILDGTAPTVQISVGEIAYNSIAVSVTANDGQSGLATSNTYKYYLNNSLKKTTTETSYTFEGLTAETSYEIKVEAYDKANNKGTDTENIKTTGVPTISKSVSYTGYYADVDGDKEPDGVIYADLAFSKSGEWADGDGTYSYNAKTNLKEYYVSKEDYTGNFGTKDVLTVKEGSEGEERFYVMALEDVNPGTIYYWYYAAYDYVMDDYATATSVDFGTGRANTIAMIKKWNSSGYGNQNDRDMWGVIQTEVGDINNPTWFVPSRGEWSVFADNLGINKGNYQNYGLSIWCWSSSQNLAYGAWCAVFNYGCMSYTVRSSRYVRLSATF